MKTKFLSLLLTACMVLSMVGCGKEPAEPNTEGFSVEVKSDTASESEEVRETVIEVTPDFKTLFPEKLGLESNRLVRVKASSDANGTEVVSLIEEYQNEEYNYACIDLNGLIIFKLYSQKDDIYMYVDMSEFALSMMEPEDYDEMKKELSNETGISEGEVTDEDVISYIKSQSVLRGYSKITESFSESSVEAEDFLSVDNIENVFAEYIRSELSLVSEDNEKLVAKYVANGSDVVITLNKASKEIEKITFSDKEETSMEIEFLDPRQIDTSWVTKDTESTAEDVVGQFMMAALAFAFSQADFEELQSIEGFDEIHFEFEDEVWEED